MSDMHIGAITQSLSVSHPPDRYVALVARAKRNEDNAELTVSHSVFPVCGIESALEHHYVTETDDDDDEEDTCRCQPYRTHREYLDAGWVYVGQETRHSPLFINEYGVIVSAHDTIDHDSAHDWMTLIMVCRCDWPPAEDDAKLAQAIEDLRKETLEAVKNDEQEEQQDMKQRLKPHRPKDDVFPSEDDAKLAQAIEDLRKETLEAVKNDEQEEQQDMKQRLKPHRPKDDVFPPEAEDPDFGVSDIYDEE